MDYNNDDIISFYEVVFVHFGNGVKIWSCGCVTVARGYTNSIFDRWRVVVVWDLNRVDLETLAKMFSFILLEKKSIPSMWFFSTSVRSLLAMTAFLNRTCSPPSGVRCCSSYDLHLILNRWTQEHGKKQMLIQSLVCTCIYTWPQWNAVSVARKKSNC